MGFFKQLKQLFKAPAPLSKGKHPQKYRDYFGSPDEHRRQRGPGERAAPRPPVRERKVPCSPFQEIELPCPDLEELIASVQWDLQTTADRIQQELQELVCLMEAKPPPPHQGRKQLAAVIQHDLEGKGGKLNSCHSVENFDFHKVLGKGSFGKVMLSEMRGSGEHFAIKVLKKDNILINGLVENTKVEQRVLALAAENPFLTHLYTSFQTKEFLFFVMEYVNGGDLFFHIEENGRFDLLSTQFYAAEMTCGLQFLHKNGVIHRDLKLENVMLDREGHIKFVDFGLCKDNMFGEKHTFTFCGSEHYIAPEIFQGKEYSFPVDWWSFGVLVFEMLIGEFPFHGNNVVDLTISVCTETPQYPSWINQESKDFLEKLLERDPTLRLGAAGHIRAHPFFENIDWPALEKRDVEPPFKPLMEDPYDCRYFSQDFLSEMACLSQCAGRSIISTDQLAFSDFSFINPKWICSD